MSKWVNADGLPVYLGVSEATSQDPTVQPAGEYNTREAVTETEVAIDLAELSTSTQKSLNDFVSVPKNAFIEEVVITVETAATSGGSATLDVGFNKQDGTALDVDGLAVGVPLADLVKGAKLHLTANSADTGVGALVGTRLTDAGQFVSKAGTAVFTAGRIRVRVRWFA